MAQSDMNIANQGFPAFRSDLNDALAALVSNSSGATAPSTTFAHQFWVDTAADPSVLKIRNADNDAWITIGEINQTDDKFKLTPADGVSTDTISELTSAAGVTIDGVLLKDNGASLGGNLTFTGTGNRITGDFSNATVANRVFFQDSTTNAATVIAGIPNGTGTVTAFQAIGNSDPTNASFADLRVTGTTSVALSANRFGTGTYLPLTFSTNGSERMRIDTSGNLLVGTTSATNKFVVAGDSGGTAVAQIINTTSSGNVISLASTLESNGNNTSSAHFQGNTSSVGNWYLFGNGTTSYSSDERLKKNIETTREGYLQDICRLRVVKYNWKIDSDETPKELGLIAQEVEQVFPGLVQDDLNPVSKDDDTLYKQLKQSVIPFMLLKSIQELKAINDAQASRIETLEAKVAALESGS